MAVRNAWWRSKRGAREALLWLLYRSGAAFLHGRLFGPRKTVILCYHTAGDGGGVAYPNNVLAEAAFRRQMSYLRKHHRVVPLEECVRRFHDGERGRSAGVALTFDDGYRSCLDVVAPILAEHGFRATFFVIPGYIDGGKGKWDDVLHRAMKPFRKSVLRGRKDEIAGLIDRLGPDARRWEEASARSLLGWDGVKRLRAMGHSVESHSMNHYYLGTQPARDQEREIAASKARLEEILREPIRFLAYPFGAEGSYTSETKALAKDARYAAALGCDQRYLEDSADLFSLQRMGIAADTPFWKFKLMLSGLYF